MLINRTSCSRTSLVSGKTKAQKRNWFSWLLMQQTTSTRDYKLKPVCKTFLKPFDKVNHQKLVAKLEQMRVCYQYFLSCRTHCAATKGSSLSKVSKVTSGSPQGNMLGPTLFPYCINSLPHNIRSTFKLFADDTIIYSTSQDHAELLDDLDKLQSWKEKWHIEN